MKPPIVTRYLKRQLLERADQIIGDRERLAALLDVDRHSLELWLAGRATLPERVFFAAMDIVLRDDIARANQDRRRGPRTDEATHVTLLR